eukprot:2594695-Rhodomonas_salina.2
MSVPAIDYLVFIISTKLIVGTECELGQAISVAEDDEVDAASVERVSLEETITTVIPTARITAVTATAALLPTAHICVLDATAHVMDNWRALCQSSAVG